MPRYKNNQIIEMVCQLRFSTILRLNSDSDELLSKFQEKIKDNYPNYKMIDESVFDVKMDGQEKEIESITPQILRNNIKNHTFESADGKERINLTCNFISFSTRKYVGDFGVIFSYTKIRDKISLINYLLSSIQLYHI